MPHIFVFIKSRCCGGMFCRELPKRVWCFVCRRTDITPPGVSEMRYLMGGHFSINPLFIYSPFAAFILFSQCCGLSFSQLLQSFSIPAHCSKEREIAQKLLVNFGTPAKIRPSVFDTTLSFRETCAIGGFGFNPLERRRTISIWLRNTRVLDRFEGAFRFLCGECGAEHSSMSHSGVVHIASNSTTTIWRE